MKDHFVLIDCDAGTDDALAIWMILRAHQDPLSSVKLVGITCVNGNTSVENSGRNVSHILKAAGETEVPVYLGADQPLLEPFKHPIPPFHGENGFGDVELDPIVPNISPEHAVLAIIRLAQEHKGRLSILALAPLTNLAMALRLDPSIANCCKSVYVMGGNIEGEGNTTISGEFNFAIDPEAAFVVLHSFPFPIVISPWEVCKREATSHEWRMNELGKIQTPQMTLLNKVEGKILEKYTDIWIPCDQLAAAAFLEPELVVAGSKSLHCTIELHGNHTRGLLVLDHMDLYKKTVNVKLITVFHSELYRKMLIWGAGGAASYK